MKFKKILVCTERAVCGEIVVGEKQTHWWNKDIKDRVEKKKKVAK